MQIQPRQQLLEIWQAIGRHSFPGGEWEWGDEGGQSSVADSERLLCLLYPATEIPEFRLDDPDTTDADVLAALRTVGSRSDIPVRLLEVLHQYMTTHTDEKKSPTFAGGHYFSSADEKDEPTPEQLAVGVVDSYSMSVTLCLATLGFLKVFTGKPRRAEVRELAEELRVATSLRLTAAMVSLLRSFTVSVFDSESSQGEALVGLVGQGRLPDRLVVQQLQRRLKPLRATIRDRFTIGVDIVGDLDDENQLFECGWSWSIVDTAPPVDTTVPIGQQPAGVAQPVPYLYFTVSALDGIVDLFSDRTLTLGLLSPEQQGLAEALRLRWEITQRYWSLLARFGEGRWPLEDIPWRTTGQRLESEYFSLLVTAILAQDHQRRRGSEDDLSRMASVLERLAERGRITGRMTGRDGAVALHSPGVRLPLHGSDRIGPPMQWTMRDFSAQLLKRTIQLGTLSRTIPIRDRMLRLGETALEHLWQRRLRSGRSSKLWDDVTAVFPEAPLPPATAVSWSATERLVECMVAARYLYEEPPLRSTELTQHANSLISEATHLFGKELLVPSSSADGTRAIALKSIEVALRRAREVVDERPSTACALALQVLVELDAMIMGRRAAARGM
jgi:hypothetical protein